MYRAVVSPRIWVLEGGRMTIDVGPKCVLLPGALNTPTIQVCGDPRKGPPGLLTLNLTDATIPLGMRQEISTESAP